MSDPSIYPLVERAVSARPIDPDGHGLIDFVNRELFPLLGQIRTLVNALGVAFNAINFSVGAGVPATVLTGVGIYVRTDAVSASTVLYVSYAGVWSPVTVP